MNSSSADPRTAATPPVRRGRPRKTVQEREESERRAELLQAAARLFRSQGYDATSTRDIATAAGMQSGSPFYYFESKSAMNVVGYTMSKNCASKVFADAGFKSGEGRDQVGVVELHDCFAANEVCSPVHATGYTN